ncbi:MAG: hypothetical protein DRN20_00275 [Thermoplasmata archaeon]|nr:MAG: hypothetical protein DRN20_00275 [Thermoplasmata archaeon]
MWNIRLLEEYGGVWLKKGIVAAGVVILVLGLVLTLLFWPLVAVKPLYYSGPYELPSSAHKGDTYKLTGKVYGAVTKGKYTYLVIDFDNGESVPLVEKGTFNKGNRVIVVIKVTEELENASEGAKEKATMTKEEKDALLEGAKMMDESTMELIYNAMREAGIDISIRKAPDTLGIVGIIVVVVGIILAIVGAVIGKKAPAVPTPPEAPQIQPEQPPVPPEQPPAPPEQPEQAPTPPEQPSQQPEQPPAPGEPSPPSE